MKKLTTYVVAILVQVSCFATTSQPESEKVVLVTGAAGFVGSHLSKRLVKDNPNIHLFCLDDLSTGRYENISELVELENVTWINHDVVYPIDIKCDEIYHLACPASPPKYQLDPVKTIETSVLGAFNMLKLAKKYNAKIFFSSTSEIYGDPEEHPQKETYLGNVNTMGPRACYDESKRVSETIFYEFNKFYGVDVRIARIFNTYGPFMDPEDGRVVTNFISQALQNAPLTIYGEGLQTRSFCFVDDLVSGILALMNQDETIGPVNLGNPEEYTMLSLAEIIKEMTGSTSEIVHLPLPKDDPTLRRPDISKARKYLGWEPKVSVLEGLQKTVAHFQKNEVAMRD